MRARPRAPCADAFAGCAGGCRLAPIRNLGPRLRTFESGVSRSKAIWHSHCVLLAICYRSNPSVLRHLQGASVPESVPRPKQFDGARSSVEPFLHKQFGIQLDETWRWLVAAGELVEFPALT